MYKLALILHLIGLILLAGSTFFSFISFRQIFKLKNSNELHLTNSTITTAKFGFGLGIALMAVSGVVFLSMASSYSTQLWFRVKMVCVLLIIVNNFVIGRPAMKKLHESEDNASSHHHLKLFYYGQFFLILGILTLSAFKFL